MNRLQGSQAFNSSVGSKEANQKDRPRNKQRNIQRQTGAVVSENVV